MPVHERHRGGAPEDVDVHQCAGGNKNDSEQGPPVRDPPSPSRGY
jgi:hypothetical protein